jgi:hypothetical protein
MPRFCEAIEYNKGGFISGKVTVAKAHSKTPDPPGGMRVGVLQVLRMCNGVKFYLLQFYFAIIVYVQKATSRIISFINIKHSKIVINCE